MPCCSTTSGQKAAAFPVFWKWRMMAATCVRWSKHGLTRWLAGWLTPPLTLRVGHAECSHGRLAFFFFSRPSEKLCAPGTHVEASQVSWIQFARLTRRRRRQVAFESWGAFFPPCLPPVCGALVKCGFYIPNKPYFGFSLVRRSFSAPLRSPLTRFVIVLYSKSTENTDVCLKLSLMLLVARLIWFVPPPPRERDASGELSPSLPLPAWEVPPLQESLESNIINTWFQMEHYLTAMEAILIIRTRFSLRNYDLDWSMQILSKCSIRIHLVVVDIAGGGKV